MKPSTEDVGNKLRTSQSSNRMSLHATTPASASPSVASIPTAVHVEATTGQTVYANPTASKAKTAVIVPSVGIPTPLNATVGATPSGAGAAAAGGDDIDWIKVPLPPHWECKLPKGTSKVT